ncbi:MAG: hypothetical protein CL833_06110 [Crocinitomicaceae bacterium]|nr:hypothetical protein [Crocinitomicaceae bacterium]
MARNRVIYQSQALYISPASTGYHLQSGQGSVSEASGPGQWDYNANLSQDSAYQTGSLRWSGINDPATGSRNAVFGPSGSIYRSLIEPINRVQTINFDFNINRQDINEFGRLARIDSIVMESPTVNVSFDYYLTDGQNERKMGFNVPTSNGDGGFRPSSADYWTGDLALSGYSALSGLIDDTIGNNYFILVGKEGKDLEGEAITSYVSDSTNFDVISIGNGFISDYSVSASVGAVPTASVTVEAFNIKTDNNASGISITHGGGSTGPLTSGNGLNFSSIPAVDQVNGTTGIQLSDTADFVGSSWADIPRFARYAVPTYNTGNADVAALRPGDILFSMSNSGDYIGFTDMNGNGNAHLQSMDISVPMSRTILQRLGNTFGYSRVVDLPLNVDVSLSAVLSEFNKNNLFENLASTQKHDFTLTLRTPNALDGTAGDTALVFKVKGARLDSESFTSAIGDNETVDMTFSTQVGGSNDTDNGLFMEGSYFRFPTINYYPLGTKKTSDAAYKGDGGQ